MSPAEDHGATRRAARKTTATANEPEVELQLDKLKRPPFEEDAGEAFPARNWQPPPPPVTARSKTPPPPPPAPPLPFSYFGRINTDGKVVVFLNRGELNFPVVQGDTIEGTYRVEEILPNALVLTYLPLQQRQTLSIGAAR